MNAKSPTPATGFARRTAIVLGVLVAAAPFLLAVDALRQADVAGGTTLLIHAGLSLPLALALWAGWSRPAVGTVVYGALGVAYGIGAMRGNGLMAAVLVTVPLFLIAWLHRRSLAVDGGVG